MSELILSEGVWPVMMTPYKEDGSIDFPAYERLIDFYIGNGASGLFASCWSSEIDYLTEDEIFALARSTVEYVNGRIPIVAGVKRAVGLGDYIDSIRKISETGVNAIVISPSHFVEAGESDGVLLSRLNQILNALDGIKFGMYECPSPYHRILSAELLREIADTRRFVFHKDTCCDLPLIQAKIDAIQTTPLLFFNANSKTLLASLQYGAHGYCGVGTNFYPELFAWLCSNRWDSQSQVVSEYICSSEQPLCDQYPLGAKYFLNLRDVQMNVFTRMDKTMSKQTEEKLTDMFLQYQDFLAAFPTDNGAHRIKRQRAACFL